MSKKKSFKLRELLKRLKPYGVESMKPQRVKGSERILVKPHQKESKRGPQYPIKDHGPGTEITIPVIRAILRRFGIDEDEFWD